MKSLVTLILIVVMSGCSQPVQSTSDAPAQAAVESERQDQPAAAKATAPALPLAAGQSSLRLAIEGMHCSGCAASTAKRLRAVDGVAACSVDFASGQAEVVFDPTTTSSEALIAAAAEGTDYAVNRLP